LIKGNFHKYENVKRSSDIFDRKPRHGNCRSPWQCIPVNSEGGVALCDCQHDKIIGNILDMPLNEIWNSDMIIEYRGRMASNDPPFAFRACPRF
jgi:hypothetical protein